MMMPTVLIAGGTGLIGKHLSIKLQEKGYRVALLSRTKPADSNMPVYLWDVEKKQIDPEAIASADYIINLAGTNIGVRWTAERIRQIIESRVQPGLLILEKIMESSVKPKAYISASATGYYGTETSDKIFSESDPPAEDFLGKTCGLWESAAGLFAKAGVRTVIIRTGVVLSAQGGVLKKMILPVKMGIGSVLGNGKQYMPWIHIDDLCGIYIKAIEDSQMNGAYNAVSPESVNNKTFMRTLARVLKKPFWFPAVPAFILKMFFGEMSGILLKGSRVSAEKICSAGYTFIFPALESAIADLEKEI